MDILRPIAVSSVTYPPTRISGGFPVPDCATISRSDFLQIIKTKTVFKPTIIADEINIIVRESLSKTRHISPLI